MEPKRHELQDAADDLSGRWERLDVRRFTGRAVGSSDHDDSPKSHLAEYQALWRLEEASLDRAKRPSLIRNAIAQLDVAFHQACEADLRATRRVAGRRLAECLRAYRTLPTGAMPLSNLNRAAQDAWNVFQEPSDVEEDESLLLRCAIGEFFKEAYTSQAVRDATTVLDFDGVRSESDYDQLLLKQALQVLSPVKDLLTSGKLLGRHQLTTAAMSIRHLAVVHEFYYFRSDCPEDLRSSHLRDWLRLSIDAAAICADQEEFNTQAYALLNKAAALAELTASDVVISQLQTLTENVQDVQKAQHLFAITDDDRGLTWSGIHLARVYARQYELSEKSATAGELEEVLRSMLETSIDAESNSLRVGDEVAQGLASLYLCAAEKEAQRLGLTDLSMSAEPEIAERARRAAEVLSATHRLPQAARAMQIAAQCELVIAGKAGDDLAKSGSRMRAMSDLTKAIAILDASGDIEQSTTERLVTNLHDSVAMSVPRWRF